MTLHILPEDEASHNRERRMSWIRCMNLLEDLMDTEPASSAQSVISGRIAEEMHRHSIRLSDMGHKHALQARDRGPKSQINKAKGVLASDHLNRIQQVDQIKRIFGEDENGTAVSPF